MLAENELRDQLLELIRIFGPLREGLGDEGNAALEDVEPMGAGQGLVADGVCKGVEIP